MPAWQRVVQSDCRSPLVRRDRRHVWHQGRRSVAGAEYAITTESTASSSRRPAAVLGQLSSSAERSTDTAQSSTNPSCARLRVQPAELAKGSEGYLLEPEQSRLLLHCIAPATFRPANALLVQCAVEEQKNSFVAHARRHLLCRRGETHTCGDPTRPFRAAEPIGPELVVLDAHRYTV